MDPAKLHEYVAAYDRRSAARQARREADAESARSVAPVLADICREYGARQVRLFGSLVTGNYGASPDIDLAVNDVPAERFFDLLAALQIQAAPFEVDLVDMAAASPELLQSIEAHGRVL